MAQTTEILLAEDDPNLGLLLAEFLKKKGYGVTWAQNGDEALDCFVKGSFDLCVLDVMMPKKDGFSLAKDIRATHLDVPIIFLTAKAMEEDTLQGFKAGADDYLTKPFDMEELKLIVRNRIAERRKMRERFSRGVTLEHSAVTAVEGDGYDISHMLLADGRCVPAQVVYLAPKTAFGHTLAQQLADATFYDFPQASHAPFLSHETDFVEALRLHLEQHA